MEKIITTIFVKWKIIEEFPRYKISNNGLLMKDGKLHRIFTRKKCKYKYVILDGFNIFGSTQIPYRKRIDLHRLVFNTFSELKHQKGYQIHHKDFDYTNNHISNLILITKDEHWDLHRAFNKSKNS